MKKNIILLLSLTLLGAAAEMRKLPFSLNSYIKMFNDKGLSVPDYCIINSNFNLVCGTIKNLSRGNLSNIVIQFNLYNQENQRVGGVAEDRIDELAPDETWKFEAFITRTDVKSVKPKAVIAQGHPNPYKEINRE